jgi:hypothetical protein
VVERLRAQLRRVILANALGYLAVLLLVAGGLVYVDKRDTQRQQEICGLIIVSDDSYRAHPAGGSGGTSFAKALHDYRRQIGCKDTVVPTLAPPSPSASR